MDQAKAPTTIETAIANANLSSHQFVDHILAHQSELRYASTSTILAIGAARHGLRFENASYNSESQGALHIAISVLERNEDAVNAFRTHLMSWQLPLDRVLQALEAHIGSYSLRSRTVVIWVRNNHFARLSLDGSGVADAQYTAALEPLAHAIDAFLTSSTIPEGSSDIKVPSLGFVEALPDYLSTGSKLDLKLADHATSNFAEARALSSNPNVLLPYAPSDASGSITLHAQQPGQVQLTILAAHRETLHPGFTSHNVHIIDTGSNAE